jgi:hypothetical protein
MARDVIFPSRKRRFAHSAGMFFPRRLFANFSIVAFLASIALGVFAPSAQARERGQLALATSAEDPVLIARLVGLSPSVDPEEARRVVSLTYTTGRELASKWKMGSSPTIHSFLINMGIKKAGYCHHFATELMLRLDALNLKTLEQHWGESDAGTDTEHNLIVITARGQPFEQGIMLDNWRRSGRLLWGSLHGDPDHKWNENKDAFNRRLRRKKVSTSDQPQAKTTAKPKVESR